MYTHLLTLNNDTGYLLKELRINKLINLKGIHLEGKQLLAVNTCMYFRTDLWIFRPIIPYNFRKWNHLSKRKVYSPWQRSLIWKASVASSIIQDSECFLSLLTGLGSITYY